MDGRSNGNGRSLDAVWWTGGEVIADKLGIDHRDIPDLVAKENLPAFKWRGRWRILPSDAVKWSRTMAKRCLSKRSPKSRAGPGRKAPTGRSTNQLY